MGKSIKVVKHIWQKFKILFLIPPPAGRKETHKTINYFSPSGNFLMIFINVAQLINTHLNDYKLLYNCCSENN